MTASEQLAQFAAGSKALPKLCREYKKERATVHLKELVGGALSFYAAAAVAKSDLICFEMSKLSKMGTLPR